MSTFTIIHHVHEEIGFKQGSDWQASEAQLSGTVHCRFPRWIEWMTHDINVHIPHHVSTAIPSYNLRMAHKSLETNWGPYLRRTKFSWNLMWSILARCQLHHEEHKWERFHDEGAVLSVASNGSSDFA